MSDFNILISKAVVKSINFELDDNGQMNWVIQVALQTKSGEEISSVTVGNKEYYSKFKMDLPSLIESSLRGFFSEVTPKIADKIMSRHKELEATIDV